MRTTGTLVLMGSGETTPTMVTVHQDRFAELTARLGRDDLRAAVLTTPYGFQENAAEITRKARHYFAHNVGREVGVVDAADVEGADDAEVERLLDAVRRADWLFAGPGSPSYALRQWRRPGGTAGFGDAMGDVHRRGGTVVLASAAAVTAGSHAIPVYEIYKAGEPARWLDGLGLVEQLTGWPCVVVPHFDNAEGGTHDTRFCYLGERRLSAMEAQLDDDAWILGVDEHTACTIDGAEGSVTVEGRGAVHVRRHGAVVLTVPAGEQVAMAGLAAVGTGTAAPEPGRAADAAEAGREAPAGGAPVGDAGEPFAEALAEQRARFESGLDAQDGGTATAAALATEQLLRDWATDVADSDAMDRGVAQLRAMITRLGTVAGEGMHDHTELVRPVIETLLHVREDARQRRVYEVADHIRGHMDADGIRVKDTREGTEWEWDALR